MSGSPSTSRPTKRLGSGRSGFSTRMTRAPSQARRYVRNGSVVACSRARTVSPSRARVMRRGGPRHGPPPPPTLGRAPAEPWRASGWIEDVSSDPAVHHAHGLAGRPLERAGRAQADLGAEGERVVQVALDPRRDAGVAARLGLDDDRHPL